MKVLFDHCTPVPLRRHLTGHSIDTAYELGWETRRNGVLLDLAEVHGYEILLTTDQSIRYQQNILGRQIGILLLLSNSWPRIQLRIELVQDALDNMHPGDFREVPIPSLEQERSSRPNGSGAAC